jgi:serine/threonine protein phosphatase PrpC
MTATPVASVQVDASGLTDVGRKRKANEDHFVIMALRQAAEVRQTSVQDSRVFERLQGQEALLLVVADGVGGRAGGAIASETAVTSLVEYLADAAGCVHGLDTDREHEFLERLESAVRQTHQRIFVEGGGRGQGMATTLTMAVLIWPRAYLLHVGDSRAFYLHKGRLRQLTRDQTTGEYMLDAGAWTEEQARTVPAAGALFSALGGDELTIAVGLVDLQPGDVLLLCSDGLTRHVPDERIAEVLGRAADSESACRELVSDALEGGGSDNITVVVARMQG